MDTQKPQSVDVDNELAEQMAAGNTRALGLIAQRYQELVLSLAYRYTRNWADAEDISQEAFIRVFHSAGRYQRQSEFKTWLYRIVVNLCMDHHRKNKSAVPLDKVAEEIVSKTPADALETGEISAIVQKAVSQLPEKQKIAVLLHRYENLSHAQICEVTGWTKSAVESLLVRAYGNLRETLKKLNKGSD